MGLAAAKLSAQHSVAETMDRLERAAKERDLVVVARVDHAGAAEKVGLTLRPTQLLIFGHPTGWHAAQGVVANRLGIVSRSKRWRGKMGPDRSGWPTTIRHG